MTVDEPTATPSDGDDAAPGGPAFCTNCGTRPPADEYTLRFENGPGGEREMDLMLCRDCCETICSESGVELL